MSESDERHAPAEVSSEIERLNAKAASEEPLRLADLLSLMAILRHPVRGCRWDREQNFASIAPYTIEEAYEVADAIARGDMPNLKNELGDLLLQVVYHAQMAKEDAQFDFAEVADAVTRKMIRRHPHVFGDEKLRTSIEISGLWDRVKAEEKREADAAAGTERGLLDDVPVGLPALTRSVKLQKRAAKVGFDWAEASRILDKVKEEIAELEQELAAGQQHAIEEELGDLLFVLANFARRLSIDPETALRNANEKFRRRFNHIEEQLKRSGHSLDAATLEEMEALWNEAKALEKV